MCNILQSQIYETFSQLEDCELDDRKISYNDTHLTGLKS
jgi:hypothetical protein